MSPGQDTTSQMEVKNVVEKSEMVAEMKELLATVGVQRCAGTGPTTQCRQGKAECGCGADPPCCFTLVELQTKVRALPRPPLATAASR